MSTQAQQVSARPSDVAVRKTETSDIEHVSQMLARAFSDDPLMLHLVRDEENRPAKLVRIFKMLHKLGLPHGSCFTTSGYECATLWRPPNEWHLPWWQYVINGPEMLGIFGVGALNVMNTMDIIEKVHPKEPHWYLQVIGTDPPKQGKGFASLAMRHRLGVADASGTPCYLESSKPTNIPVYRAFGFEVVREINLPNGPTLWPMWREPQTP
ncbi:MAG TPA: GNAT family N-acetyltransferase [Rhizomicrobium sp.]|jgi:GNAT superfamily N-acetyltransferase|nr:GNAT family N-acetyltransferase [Rhizomicrobium sp.]